MKDKENKIREELEKFLGKARVLEGELLSLHTTFQIGGPAKYYFEAQTKEEMVKAANLAKKLKLPYFILGGGSNILVGDKGFNGLVIKNKISGIKILGYKGNVSKLKSLNIQKVLLEVGSGVLINQLVRFAIEQGLAGLEGFLGLPGTVGGAVSVNAHWQQDGQEKRIESLIVSKNYFEKTLISVILGFTKEEKETLWARAKQAVNYRQKTQPIAPSAGCIFKNISKSEAMRIGTPNQTTSTGFLISASGLKGTKLGQVQISPVHANFMINLGGGKAEEAINLINLVKSKIKEKFNVKLEEEILRVGEF